MVIAFKVSKTGSRYMPKPQRKDSSMGGDGGSASNSTKLKREEVILRGNQGSSSTSEGEDSACENVDASFSVNLFPDGFSVGKPTEDGKNPPYGYELTECVYPYDRTSDSFLRAIDCGWLPSELLEEIPCTYIDGCVVCELRDYRESVPSTFAKQELITWKPTVHRVLLRPSTENIVKDIVAMSDDSWSYRDLIEVESKVLKAMKPSLCLDPSPAVAAKAHVQTYNRLKFNLGLSTRRYRTHKSAFMDRRIRLAATKTLTRQDSFARLKSPDTNKPDTPDDTKSDHSVEIIQESLGVTQPATKHHQQLVAQAALARTSSSGVHSPHSPSNTANIASGGGSGVCDVFGKRERDHTGVKMEANNKRARQEMKTQMKPQFRPVHSFSDLAAEQSIKEEQQQMVGSGAPDEFQHLMRQPGMAPQQGQHQWQARKPQHQQGGMYQNRASSPMGQSGLSDHHLHHHHPGVMSPPKHANSQGTSAPAVALEQQVHQQFGSAQGVRHPLQKASPFAASPSVHSPSTPVRSPGPLKAEPGVGVGVGVAPTQATQVANTSQAMVKHGGDSMSMLVAAVQRFGLDKRERKVDELPPPKKTQPSWQLLSVALADTSDDYQEPKGRKSLANTIIGGNVNGKKTRCLQFERHERVLASGQAYPMLQVTARSRLLLCGRARDAMVEAVVQIGDEQEDESSSGQVPYTVLPTLPNADAADLFARQYIETLEKEGYTLSDDIVQLSSMPRGTAVGSAVMNAAAMARPMQAGASQFGHQQQQQQLQQQQQQQQQLGSPRMMISQQQMAQLQQQQQQARMPPPTANRLAYSIPQSLAAAKSLQPLESQLVAQHQHQHQHQQLHLQQQQMNLQQQRPQLLSQIPNQMNANQMNANSLMQYQMMRNSMQKKALLGGPGGAPPQGNIGGMVGLGSVPGMGGIGGMAGMGGISGLGMNQLINHRPGMTPVNSAFMSKRMAAVGPRPPGGGARGMMAGNLSGAGMASNAAGLNLLASRGSLAGIRPGMGPPKAPGSMGTSGYYLQQQQQQQMMSPQQQQLMSSQIGSMMNPGGQQQQQGSAMSAAAHMNSLNAQQQLLQQQHLQQQLVQQQQMSQAPSPGGVSGVSGASSAVVALNQASPQHSSGAVGTPLSHPPPSSPQVSSQTMGAGGGGVAASSPMEITQVRASPPTQTS